MINRRLVELAKRHMNPNPPEPRETSQNSLDSLVSQQPNSLDSDSWESELKQYIEHLSLTESIPRSYIWELARKKAKPSATVDDIGDIWDKIHIYLERNMDDFGLYQSSAGKIYKRELIDAIKKIGEDLLQKKGYITNRDITLQLGLNPDKKTTSHIRGVSEAHYKSFGWKKGEKVKWSTTYVKI